MKRAALILAAAAFVTGPAPALAITPRASLTDIESQVMCTVCKTPLAVSQSAEANDERRFISRLIAKGETKPQILRAMVAQYGPAVLALPPAHGFDVTLYVIPPAVLLIGGALLAYTLPRWRRRTRATAAAERALAQPPSPQDTRRLDEDLARYGR